MDIRVLNKLHKIANQFVDHKLTDIAFLKKKIKGRDILVAELTFKDEADVQRTAVFALDKELTEGDYEEIVERLTRLTG